MHSLVGPFPHFAFELCAYLIGARLYWRMARTQPVQSIWQERFFLLAGAIGGAALGSKALHVLEHLPALMQAGDLQLWLAGKSIVGGLIGGTLGVEMAKRSLGWRGATGDAWVPALAAGLVIGRIGCQLSGTWDQTYGISTALPWAWDYGDGIGRHPTALYEIILVALFFAIVWLNSDLRHKPGARFAAFLAGYCAIRLGLDFLKPPFGVSAVDTLPVALYAGITAIQWACVAGVAGYVSLLSYRLRPVFA